jgi:hypothetical protein
VRVVSLLVALGVIVGGCAATGKANPPVSAAASVPALPPHVCVSLTADPCETAILQVATSDPAVLSAGLVAATAATAQDSARYGADNAILVGYRQNSGSTPVVWVYSRSSSDSGMYLVQRYLGEPPASMAAALLTPATP